MALLLRFGGVPARVATGFSPGGFRRRQDEWIVRDRDAHSWVEAWFDGIGWVTFDPTPSATPARSLIAAIDDPDDAAAGDSAADAPATQPGGARNPAGARRELDPAGGGGGPGVASVDQGTSPWLYAGGGAALLLLIAVVVLLLRRRRRARDTLPPADRAVADLVTALRRAGRPVAPGTTLIELERRLGRLARRRLLPARAPRRPLRHRRRRPRRPRDSAPGLPPRARPSGSRLARASGPARLVGAAARSCAEQRPAERPDLDSNQGPTP